MILARHTHSKRVMLALYDDELKGRILEEKNIIIDLSSRWYEGETAPADDVATHLSGAESVHAIGEKSVQLLLEKKLVTKDDVKTVAGVPHVQLFNIGS